MDHSVDLSIPDLKKKKKIAEKDYKIDEKRAKLNLPCCVRACDKPPGHCFVWAWSMQTSLPQVFHWLLLP